MVSLTQQITKYNFRLCNYYMPIILWDGSTHLCLVCAYLLYENVNWRCIESIEEISNSFLFNLIFELLAYCNIIVELVI